MGLSPHMKIKKGRPLANWPGGNTPPVINITAFNAVPDVLVPDTGFTAVATDAEQGDISANIVWNGVTADETPGIADATIAGVLDGDTVSNLAAATYDIDATVDGGGLQQLTIVISGGETLAAIAGLINTAVAGANCVYGPTGGGSVNGFRVESSTTGVTSTVVLAAGTTGSGGGDFFAAISAADGAVTLETPVDGLDQTVGQIGSGGNPTLTFTVGGAQDVEASITDGFGSTVVDTESITVQTP